LLASTIISEYQRARTGAPRLYSKRRWKEVYNPHGIQAGQPAPEFRLKDQNENENPVRLGPFRCRPVVLIFYPFD